VKLILLGTDYAKRMQAQARAMVDEKAEFPIVSSSASTLQELVVVSEEPKLREDIFLRLSHK
jgi:hypothetical protein